MSRARVVFLTVLLSLSAARAARADPYASATLGLPELLHVELGVTVGRLAIAARGGVTLFTLAAGGSLTYHALGTPGPSGLPRQALLLGVHVMKDVSTSAWISRGAEEVAAYVAPRVGWGYQGDGGLLVRLEVGAAVYSKPDHLEAGPTFELTLGYRF